MKRHVSLDRAVTAPQHHGGAAAHVHHRSVPARARWPRLSAFFVEHLLVLPFGAAIALLWANLAPQSYYETTFAITFAVNDVGMAFFFALMTKEVVEATAPAGVLHPWRRAALPMVAAVGIVAVSIPLFIVATLAVDEPLLQRAWLVPAAVDVALAYFLTRLIFRPQHPAVPFTLLLALSADALALLILAVWQPLGQTHYFVGTGLMAAALVSAGTLRRVRVKSFWPYVLLSGSLSWLALYWLGVHPALALVPIIPFLPHAARDPGFFVDALPGARDALSRFEQWWRYPVQLILFFFGMVNAGVSLRALEAGTWALPMAGLAAKPIGLLAGVALAIAIGLHLPHRVGWRELTVVGLTATIGFTIALYLSAAVLGPGQLLSEIRMGAILGLAGGPLALLAARFLRVGRFAR